jgi:hypothetical protein
MNQPLIMTVALDLEDPDHSSHNSQKFNHLDAFLTVVVYFGLRRPA